MTSWLDHVWHRRIVDEVYSAPPTLDDIDLFDVRLDREGPRIHLRFNFATYADRPKPEWSQNCNRVQVELAFVGVRELVVHDFGWTNVANLRMTPVAEDALEVQVHGDTTSISFRCGRPVTLKRLSAYIHNPNAPL
ncbi:Imm50 family immunity protein [Lentzea sp. NPDC055074]